MLTATLQNKKTAAGSRPAAVFRFTFSDASAQAAMVHPSALNLVGQDLSGHSLRSERSSPSTTRPGRRPDFVLAAPNQAVGRTRSGRLDATVTGPPDVPFRRNKSHHQDDSRQSDQQR